MINVTFSLTLINKASGLGKKKKINILSSAETKQGSLRLRGRRGVHHAGGVGVPEEVCAQLLANMSQQS